MPLGAHEAACGFVQGRSIVHNAQPHVGQAVVVNADIRNCFPSVSWSLVLGALRRHLGGCLSAPAISLLVDLTTARGALPVGAPSSPALLNLVLRRTDEILHARATRLGGHYTRYADDLTFSGGAQVVGLLKLAERTLAALGLELDPKKTNVFRRGRRQMVTGLVVNDQVSVPRAVRRRLRAAVHQVEQGGQAHWDGLPQDLAALKGRLGFV
ncbi:MAG: reverse transcriptase family protein, partial [Betaproteobacteria bacterium]